MGGAERVLVLRCAVLLWVLQPKSVNQNPRTDANSVRGVFLWARVAAPTTPWHTAIRVHARHHPPPHVGVKVELLVLPTHSVQYAVVCFCSPTPQPVVGWRVNRAHPPGALMGSVVRIPHRDTHSQRHAFLDGDRSGGCSNPCKTPVLKVLQSVRNTDKAKEGHRSFPFRKRPSNCLSCRLLSCDISDTEGCSDPFLFGCGLQTPPVSAKN